MANKKQKSIIKNNELVSLIKNEIVKHGGVKVTGFGIFKVVKIKAIKKAFNPYTKKYESFPSYKKIKFLPSKKLKELIR